MPATRPGIAQTQSFIQSGFFIQSGIFHLRGSH